MLLLLIVLLVPAAQANPVSIRYTTKTDTKTNIETLTARTKGCVVQWVVPLAGHIRHGMVDNKTRCKLAFTKQMKLHERLLKQLMARKQPPLIHTINWGLVQSKSPEHYSVVLRLSKALKRSPLWDLKKGKPAYGRSSKILARLVNEAGVLKELKYLFAQYGMRSYATKVENIKVNPVKKLKVKTLLAKQGLKSSDKIPHDFTITLGVDPSPERLFPDPKHAPRNKYQ